LSSARSRARSACSVSACERTDTYSPAAIDMDPAVRPASTKLAQCPGIIVFRGLPTQTTKNDRLRHQSRGTVLPSYFLDTTLD
jgi:hypothetical protein